RRFIDRILDQAVRNNAKAEKAEDQEQYIGIAVRISLDPVAAFAHFIEPVPTIDAAGNKGKEKYHAAGGGIGLSGKSVDLIIDHDHPVNAINPAGDNGKEDAKSNVAR